MIQIQVTRPFLPKLLHSDRLDPPDYHQHHHHHHPKASKKVRLVCVLLHSLGQKVLLRWKFHLKCSKVKRQQRKRRVQRVYGEWGKTASACQRHEANEWNLCGFACGEKFARQQQQQQQQLWPCVGRQIVRTLGKRWGGKRRVAAISRLCEMRWETMNLWRWNQSEPVRNNNNSNINNRADRKARWMFCKL